MANPNRLLITYHPARRDISFTVKEDSTELKNDYESLKKYSINEKGKFVLSLYGNEFFDDILKPFSGKDSVEVYLKTTRLEYEDFKQRVNEFNTKKGKNDSEIKLLPLLECDELVDMKTSFNEIKIQGEKIVKLLDSHWNNIQNIKCTSNNAKDYLMKVAQKIRGEKEGIEKNLKALSEDNNVNLCLIGVHSSGKSTLINTLLGYKILPVDIRPETAKMLKIKGVSDLESSYIKFSKCENNEDKNCSIYWDKRKNCLYVKDSNILEGFMTLLNEELGKNKSCKLHEQLYFILDYLNKNEEINAKIDLGFPIPFNSDDLKFTFYDTPGADSNVGYHKKILSEALENQTNSILLFVLKPDSLSGSGNVELMNELLEKSSSSNNIIDIEQSFFIFNYADAHATELDKIKNEKLKKSENDDNPVYLAERKLFFVSAKCGFAAIATKNLVAGEEEKYTYVYDNPKTLNERYGRYYKHNHYGKSEYATAQMIERTNKAFDSEKKDDCMKYLISSGIYTLEEEIKNYGERYASAVKTSAIIKSIESAADSVSRMVKETSFGADEKVKDIQSRLDAEIKKVEEIIDSTANKYVGRFQTSIGTEIGNVEINKDTFINKVLNPVEDVLNKRLEKYLKLFSVHVNEQMQIAVQTDIEKIYRDYTNNYKIKRNEYLLAKQSDFIKDFMQQVEESEISEETKERLRNFKLPEIPEFGLDKKIDELFDSAKLFEHENIKNFVKAIAKGVASASENLDASVAKDEEDNKENTSPKEEKSIKENNASMGKKRKSLELARNAGNIIVEIGKKGTSKVKKGAKRLIDTAKDGIDDMSSKVGKWETKTIDKKKFITEVKDWFQKNQSKLTDKFQDDFKEAVNRMYKDLSDEFMDNIDLYSTKIRALMEDNKPLELLADDIKKMQASFDNAKKELETKI